MPFFTILEAYLFDLIILYVEGGERANFKVLIQVDFESTKRGDESVL